MNFSDTLASEEVFTSISIANTYEFRTQVLTWASQFGTIAWYQSNGTIDKYSNYEFVLGVDQYDQWRGEMHAENFEQWRKNRWAFGYWGYPNTNPAYPENLTGHDGNYFFVPRYIFYYRDGRIYINRNYPETYEILEQIKSQAIPEPRNVFIDLKPKLSKTQYIKNVESIIEDIRNGKYYELNYCMHWEAKLDQTWDGISVYRAINERALAPMSGYFRYSKGEILCFSPERFVSHRSGLITSQPIKGTIKRDHQNPQHDLMLAEVLHTSPKERAENMMIVDMVRHDLTHYSEPESIVVEELCKLYKFPNVYQLISTITARIPESQAIAALVRAFPPASMTGSPKYSAMQHIELYESFARGPYSGAMGYIEADGSYDFNVLIRSIYASTIASRAYLATGGAITIQSRADAEYQECILKAQFIINYFKSIKH